MSFDMLVDTVIHAFGAGSASDHHSKTEIAMDLLIICAEVALGLDSLNHHSDPPSKRYRGRITSPKKMVPQSSKWEPRI
jgi:hypothetical protein